MEKLNKTNELEEGCIWEMPMGGQSPRKNKPCLDCLKDCYRPENMSPEKEEFYKNGCKSINGYKIN